MATKKTSTPAAKTATAAPNAAAGAAKPVAANRVNSFVTKKFEDHTIIGPDGKVVGHIRVKPNSILWSPKNGHDWYGVPLSQFADFLQQNGKKQTK